MFEEIIFSGEILDFGKFLTLKSYFFWLSRKDSEPVRFMRLGSICMYEEKFCDEKLSPEQCRSKKILAGKFFCEKFLPKNFLCKNSFGKNLDLNNSFLENLGLKNSFLSESK